MWWGSIAVLPCRPSCTTDDSIRCVVHRATRNSVALPSRGAIHAMMEATVSTTQCFLNINVQGAVRPTSTCMPATLALSLLQLLQHTLGTP